MTIDISQFKTTNALEDFSLRAANDMKDFVADQIFTPGYISKKQYKKYQYDLSNYRRSSTRASSKAAAQKGDYNVFTTSSEAQLYKYATDIDPQDARDADSVVGDLQQDATLLNMEKLMIDKEVLTLGKITTAGNYPSSLNVTLSGMSKWNNTASDPLADIITGKTAVKGICGKLPNAMAIAWEAFLALSNNTSLKDRLKYTSGQSITLEQMKNLFQLDELIVAKAQYNANNEGSATQSLSTILGNYAVLFVKDPAQTRRTVTFGRTWYVTGGGSASQPGGWYTYQYTDDTRGSAAGRIQVIESGMEYDYDFATVDSQSSGKVGAGYLITTPL